MLRRSRYHLWGSPAVQAAVVPALFMTFLHAGVKAAPIGTDFDLTFSANGAVNTSVSYSVNGITVDITPYYASDPGGTLFPSWSLANGRSGCDGRALAARCVVVWGRVAGLAGGLGRCRTVG